MKRFIPIAHVVLAAGCLYTGDQTLGLPCNTDLECGGAQLCVEHVCGGPQGTSDGSSDAGSSESSDGETQTPGDDDSTPDSCDAADTVCLDGDVLQLCTDDGKLSTTGCPGLCGEAAPAQGCFDAPDGSTCYCQETREPCTTEGVFECRDAQNLRSCEAGWWQPLDCDAVCVNAGYSGADSCGPGESNDTCFCNNSCVEGTLRCVDGDTAAQCSAGAWSEYDCNDVCVENGYSFSPGCRFFSADMTESCGCV